MGQFVSWRTVTDYTIHAIDEHDKWLPKALRVYILDENGERVFYSMVTTNLAEIVPRIGMILAIENEGALHRPTPQIVIWNVLVKISGLISILMSNRVLIGFPLSEWDQLSPIWNNSASAQINVQYNKEIKQFNCVLK